MPYRSLLAVNLVPLESFITGTEDAILHIHSTDIIARQKAGIPKDTISHGTAFSLFVSLMPLRQRMSHRFNLPRAHLTYHPDESKTGVEHICIRLQDESPFIVNLLSVVIVLSDHLCFLVGVFDKNPRLLLFKGRLLTRVPRGENELVGAI